MFLKNNMSCKTNNVIPSYLIPNNKINTTYNQSIKSMNSAYNVQDTDKDKKTINQGNAISKNHTITNCLPNL